MKKLLISIASAVCFGWGAQIEIQYHSHWGFWIAFLPFTLGFQLMNWYAREYNK